MTTRDETSKPSLWKSPRVRWLAVILGGFLVIGAAYGVYWDRDLRYSVYTDDAYVSGNVVQITPQISGTVVSIGADNTQFVKAGQPLVRLDPADAKVALQAVRGTARQDGAPGAQSVRDHLGAAGERAGPPHGSRQGAETTTPAVRASSAAARFRRKSCSTPVMR